MENVIEYMNDPYLPITQTWVYSLIMNLTDHEPVVYAYSTENLDVFPLSNKKLRYIKGNLWDPLFYLNIATNRLFGVYPTFLLYLNIDKPSLVHAHFGPSGYQFLKLKNILRIPLLTSFYGYDFNMLPLQYPIWNERYKQLFRDGDLFFVEGNHAKKCLRALGCPEQKIVVQKIGIDLDIITYKPRRLDRNEIKILISASFREKKGISYALTAFGNVRQSHPELNLRLTIIGDSGGSPEEEKVKSNIYKIIDKYQLKNCTTLLGYQPYSTFLSELYGHHIFLHPSVTASNGDTEGGAPVSVIEASASGMPVLSTTHCDIPEVVIDGVSGFLVPERDVDALATKLEYLVLNPDIWEKMGLAGRNHIEKDYDIKKQIKKLEMIYDKVCNK